MKIFAISAALALAATLAIAAPQGGPDWAPVQGRQFRAQITFSGAGPNPPTYSISAPVDGSAFTIGMYPFPPRGTIPFP